MGLDGKGNRSAVSSRFLLVDCVSEFGKSLKKRILVFHPEQAKHLPLLYVQFFDKHKETKKHTSYSIAFDLLLTLYF